MPPSQQDDQPAPVGTRAIAQITESYSGPLPPSVELAEYERVLPGSADRIVSMAEGYASHNQRLEAEALRREYDDMHWGRIVAGMVVLVILGACIYALHLGHVGFATTLGSWTVVALVAVFIAGKVPDWITKSKP